MKTLEQPLRVRVFYTKCSCCCSCAPFNCNDCYQAFILITDNFFFVAKGGVRHLRDIGATEIHVDPCGDPEGFEILMFSVFVGCLRIGIVLLLSFFSCC